MKNSGRSDEMKPKIWNELMQDLAPSFCHVIYGGAGDDWVFGGDGAANDEELRIAA